MTVNLTKDDPQGTSAPEPRGTRPKGLPIVLQAAILAAGAMTGGALGFWYLGLSPLSLLA